MWPKISRDASTGSSTPARLRSVSNSTIVACVDGAVRLLRPGAISREALEAALGEGVLETPAPSSEEGEVLAPGMLSSHYAPRARLRLAAVQTREDEAALDFAGALAASGAKTRLDLSPSGDLAEAAANSFAFLRALDATGAPAIAAAAIPEQGLGAAINDRLRRAAAPRP